MKESRDEQPASSIGRGRVCRHRGHGLDARGPPLRRRLPWRSPGTPPLTPKPRHRSIRHPRDRARFVTASITARRPPIRGRSTPKHAASTRPTRLPAKCRNRATRRRSSTTSHPLRNPFPICRKPARPRIIRPRTGPTTITTTSFRVRVTTMVGMAAEIRHTDTGRIPTSGTTAATPGTTVILPAITGTTAGAAARGAWSAGIAVGTTAMSIAPRTTCTMSAIVPTLITCITPTMSRPVTTVPAITPRRGMRAIRRPTIAVLAIAALAAPGPEPPVIVAGAHHAAGHASRGHAGRGGRGGRRGGRGGGGHHSPGRHAAGHSGRHHDP